MRGGAEDLAGDFHQMSAGVGGDFAGGWRWLGKSGGEIIFSDRL